MHKAELPITLLLFCSETSAVQRNRHRVQEQRASSGNPGDFFFKPLLFIKECGSQYLILMVAITCLFIQYDFLYGSVNRMHVFGKN